MKNQTPSNETQTLLEQVLVSLIIGFSAMALAIALFGCGKPNDTASSESELTPVGKIDPSGIVVKSRATMTVSTAPETAFKKWLSPLSFQSAFAASGNQNISVVNAPSSSMTLDQSLWSVPSISNSFLDFGSLSISSLNDNNLKVCGTQGNVKCNVALIRIYSTGQSKSGLYNATDDFGAPITVSHTGGSTSGTVDLNSQNALTLQTYSIPVGKNVVKLSNFNPNPLYHFNIDFTDAGAGNYETTLVIEYALAKTQ